MRPEVVSKQKTLYCKKLHFTFRKAPPGAKYRFPQLQLWETVHKKTSPYECA